MTTPHTWFLACMAGLSVLRTGIVTGQAPGDESKTFIAWAKKNGRPIATTEPGHGISDLSPIQEIAGTARVVAVGESIHGIREFLGLRHRVIEFLVEKLGFTAVAIESGLPDAKMVYDYVLGADEPPDMWNQGFTWTMATFGEMRDLVEWMRRYNRDPTHTRKIRFYGMDVAGGNGSWSQALQQVLAYLDRVEPAYAALTRERLVSLLEKFARKDFTQSNDAYSALPLDERNSIAALTNELADRFDLLRVTYLGAGSAEDYDWARQIALNLRYSNTLVTNYEARNRANPIWNGRDWAMAQNVLWIRKREGPEGGVVVLAHNAHVQTTHSVAVSPNSTSLGMFLREMIGLDYRNIGFTFNKGAMWGGGGEPTRLEPALPSSIDGAMAQVALPTTLLNLRAVPKDGPVHHWLDQPLKQRIQNFYTEYNELQSWDGLIFVDSITPSRRSP